eukprot:8057871-Lingulodinium_polyedra.AAC.1
MRARKQWNRASNALRTTSRAEKQVLALGTFQKRAHVASTAPRLSSSGNYETETSSSTSKSP